jgi:PKHD-type hydroxylase
MTHSAASCGLACASTTKGESKISLLARRLEASRQHFCRVTYKKQNVSGRFQTRDLHPIFPLAENPAGTRDEKISVLGGKVAGVWDTVRSSHPVLMKGGTMAWDGLFSPTDLDRLESHCDTLALEQARVVGDGYSSIRSTRVAWVHRDAQTTENLYRKMEEVVLRLNAEHFRSDLSGLTTLQYARYDQAEAGYFDWHIDYGRDSNDPAQEPRKITLSLQLSEPSCYDGCELEVRAAHLVDVAPRKRGTLVAFRANALHRVTPITRGTRKSLVAWAAGPDYR